MTFNDMLKKSVVDGFQNYGISAAKVFVTLGITFLIALYIFAVYRFITRRVFYDKNFNVSMAIISVVTAGIVLAMQTNLIISLGMVGALSIVRFRTAIKEPMDLLFLFWSIGIGIVCGAGTYELAIVISLFVTVGIIVFQLIPVTQSPYLLVINAESDAPEAEIMRIVEKFSPRYRVDSKNLGQNGMDLIVEIRSKNGPGILAEIKAVAGVRSVSFLYHAGEIKG